MLNPWPQRDLFKAHVNNYRKLHGVARGTVAGRLGITESHLHGLMYDKRTRPSLNVIQLASELFEISVAVLIDDPGGAPLPGIGKDAWTAASERDRLLAATMFADLISGQLTDAEKDEIYRAYKETKDRVLRLRKAYKG